MLGLYDSSGNELTTSDNNGPGNESYINYYTATYTGTYYARVGKYYWSTTPGNYSLYVDLVRGAQQETDADYNNGSLGNADGLSFTTVGNQRQATVAGLIMGPEGSTSDNDIYGLGGVDGRGRDRGQQPSARRQQPLGVRAGAGFLGQRDERCRWRGQ